MAFWTVEAIEVANILTDGVREYASYPLDIYPKWIKNFFTFIIPFGCVNYLPLLSLIGRRSGSEAFYMLLPLLGTLFIIRKYLHNITKTCYCFIDIHHHVESY